QGLQGPQGTQGVRGLTGADGKTQYTHIAYADNSSGGGFSQSPKGKTFIGMYVDFTAEDSTDPSKYLWSKYVGDPGEKGIPGAAGTDGKTPYFHTAWANSADGKTDFSTSVSLNKLYMGTYTDYTSVDSTDPTKYNWTKIKGDNAYTHNAWSWSADGTDRFTTAYPNENLASENTLTPWSNNATNIMTIIDYRHINLTSSGNNYFGIRVYSSSLFKASTLYTMSFKFKVLSGSVQSIGGHNRNTFLTPSELFIDGIAQSGGPWSTGYKFDFVVGQTYNITVTSTTKNSITTDEAPGIFIQPNRGGTWTSYAAEVTDLKFEEGQRTIYTSPPGANFTDAYPLYQGTYSDNNPEASTSPSKYTWSRILGQTGQDGTDGSNGKDGTNGKDGVGIVPGSTVIDYQISNSGTTPPTGTWTTAIPQMKAGQYLWTRTTFTFTDDTKKSNYTVGMAGKDGNSGIIVSQTAPQSPEVNQLWQDTSASPIMIKRWIGSAWVEWGMSIDNLIVENVAIENGVFKTLSGVEINASRFVNTFTK
ncbi:hypothetical protein ACYSNT_19995, partial [Enterococcus sp. LJL90]